MPLCNLYSITKGQQAIRDIAGAMRDLTGNMPMLPGANLRTVPTKARGGITALRAPIRLPRGPVLHWSPLQGNWRLLVCTSEQEGGGLQLCL